MYLDEVSRLSYKVFPGLEIIFFDPETLKLLFFLGPDLLDERSSAWLLHCNIGLFFVDMLSFELELVVRFLKESLGRLFDIQNCSAHYTIRLLLMIIRSQVESSSLSYRLG